MKCWGANSFGQLGAANSTARGNDSSEAASALPAVNVGRTPKSLAAGEAHTCAILDDHSVKCWGQNLWGQLGLGDTLDRGGHANEMGSNLPKVNLGPGRTAKRLAAGAVHTCVILDDHSVKCWGANTYGQLGLGNTLNRGDNANEMGEDLPVVDLGLGRGAKDITASGEHTCATLDDDTLKCWGANYGGQLGLGVWITRGDGNDMGDSLPTLALGPGRTATSIGLGPDTRVRFSTTARFHVGAAMTTANLALVPPLK